jgi:hypothetical protein
MLKIKYYSKSTDYVKIRANLNLNKEKLSMLQSNNKN